MGKEYAIRMDSIDEWQQRAVDNERLRRLAVEELESTRDQLADTVEQLQMTRADLVRTNSLLVNAIAEHEELTQKLAETDESLAAAVDTVSRQQAYIDRLRQQLARPMRQVIKKAARSVGIGRAR